MEFVLFFVILTALLLAIDWAMRGDRKKFGADDGAGNYQPSQPYDIYGLPNPEEIKLGDEMSENKKGKRVSYHVVPHNNGWAIKRGREVVETHLTKAEAVQRGMELGRSHVKGQLVIHKKDGTIQEERTYGADPRNTKG